MGHDGLLAPWDALQRRGMLLADVGRLVMGLPANGVLVVNLLLYGVLILFCQNELGDVSPQRVNATKHSFCSMTA